MVEEQKSRPRSLLDLPSDLWIEICQKVVDQADFVNFSAFYDRLPIRPPPIAQTCRLHRDELMPYYYLKKVDVGCNPEVDDRIGKFVRSIAPANRRFCRFYIMSYKFFMEEREKEIKQAFGMPLFLRPGKKLGGSILGAPLQYFDVMLL